MLSVATVPLAARSSQPSASKLMLGSGPNATRKHVQCTNLRSTMVFIHRMLTKLSLNRLHYAIKGRHAANATTWSCSIVDASILRKTTTYLAKFISINASFRCKNQFCYRCAEVSKMCECLQVEERHLLTPMPADQLEMAQVVGHQLWVQHEGTACDY